MTFLPSQCALPRPNTMTSFFCLLAVLCSLLPTQVYGFAISSSKSDGKKLISSDNKTGGGGFGAKKNVVPSTHTPDTSDTTQALVQFLNSQNSIGLNDGTEVGFDTTTNRRGVYATIPFKKGEILCQIPSDCVLALSDPQLGGSDVPTMAHSGRNLLLMYIKDDQAKMVWKPYLDTLPTRDFQFDATPDFFSDEEIQALEFPRAIERAQQRQRDIQQVAQHEQDTMTFEELQFATWLASSRSFGIQMTSSEDVQMVGGVSAPTKSIRVMTPYLDLINHASNAPNAELHLIDPEKDEAWFAIRATRGIPEGKEVTICYGNGVDSSVELLLSHGFVPKDNKFDALMLKKGGDGCIESLDDWTTTLQEDEAALEAAEGNMRKVLEFRIKLKKAYADVK